MAAHHHDKFHKHSIVAKMINFSKWWLGFTGLMATTSVCPFCGQPGCPVGVGAATTIGAFFALFMQNWKEPFQQLYYRLFKNKKDIDDKK